MGIKPLRSKVVDVLMLRKCRRMFSIFLRTYQCRRKHLYLGLFGFMLLFLVLPSLDVSFELSLYPSRLQEFFLRMDVVNKTSSECFQVHQLSSGGQQWQISLLQPVDSILSSQSLFAGQAMSCFFIRKDRRKSSTSEDSIPPVSHHTDVRLDAQSNSEALFDRYVAFVFITQLRKGNIDSGDPNAPLLFSHHACHCSMSLISWLVDGSRAITTHPMPSHLSISQPSIPPVATATQSMLLPHLSQASLRKTKQGGVISQQRMTRKSSQTKLLQRVLQIPGKRLPVYLY